MRSEWARSYSRHQRWGEDVVLLVEEMRRVVEYLDNKAKWWRLQSHRRRDKSPNTRTDILQGLSAYADRQAALMKGLAQSFACRWHTMLANADINIDYPEHYKRYAAEHPTIIREARNRKKRRPAPTVAASDDDESSDEEEDSSDGEDDLDISPYR